MYNNIVKHLYDGYSGFIWLHYFLCRQLDEIILYSIILGPNDVSTLIYYYYSLIKINPLQ